MRLVELCINQLDEMFTEIHYHASSVLINRVLLEIVWGNPVLNQDVTVSEVIEQHFEDAKERTSGEKEQTGTTGVSTVREHIANV